MKPPRGHIGPLRGPLLRRGDPTEPVVLSGGRCRTYGAGPGGFAEARCDGQTLFRDLDVALRPCDEIAGTPYALERRWSAAPRRRERTFVLPDAPGMVIEWLDEGQEEQDAVLSWTVPSVKRWRVRKGCLATLDPDGRRRAFCIEPTPDWAVTHEGETLRVEGRVPASSGATVTFTAVLRDAQRSARLRDARPFGRLTAQQVRARSDLERALEDHLVVEASDPMVTMAVSWAIARLGTLLPATSSEAGGPVHAYGATTHLLAGLGALAIGSFDSAAVLSAGGPNVLRDRVWRWDHRMRPGPAPDGPESLTDVLSRFEEPAGQLLRLHRSGADGRDALARYRPWLEAWHRFDSGDVEAGAGSLARLLELGIGNGLAWGFPGQPYEDVGLTALVPATIVFGVLGASPDSTLGRLRLAPRFPASWGNVAIRNLRMGESFVSMAYRLEGQRHAFEVEQTRGAVPVNLVFEPTVPGRGIRETRVDGTVVDLDTIGDEGRVGVRLQMPLDGIRELVILEGDEPS